MVRNFVARDESGAPSSSRFEGSLQDVIVVKAEDSPNLCEGHDFTHGV